MSDANDSPDTADTADKSDRWTVRGIAPETRRKAADMAAKADMPLGRWLSRLIEHAADKSDMADVPADVFGAVLARLERLERAVFVAAMSDTADAGATVTIALDTADVSDKSDALAVAAPCQMAGESSAMADTADTKTTEPSCPTRSPVSDTETPMEAAGVAAGVVDAAGAGAGADDSTGIPGGAGAGRKRLDGTAKAERAADIKRRLAAGESKPEIVKALGISIATLNRALAE
jgi:hypothetical protein